MIREKTDRSLVIDLTGPEGNAFVLLGYAKNLAKQLDFNFEKIQTEMTSSDYENLIQVFDKYFGEYVILERWQLVKLMYYFDSYTVSGNQYRFYGVNGNFVGEIYVSGNNNLSIRSR